MPQEGSSVFSLFSLIKLHLASLPLASSYSRVAVSSVFCAQNIYFSAQTRGAPLIRFFHEKERKDIHYISSTVSGCPLQSVRRSISLPAKSFFSEPEARKRPELSQILFARPYAYRRHRYQSHQVLYLSTLHFCSHTTGGEWDHVGIRHGGLLDPRRGPSCRFNFTLLLEFSVASGDYCSITDGNSRPTPQTKVTTLVVRLLRRLVHVYGLYIRGD